MLAAKACIGPMDLLRVRNQSKSLSQMSLAGYSTSGGFLLTVTLKRSGENKDPGKQTNNRGYSQVLEPKCKYGLLSSKLWKLRKISDGVLNSGNRNLCRE